MKFGVREICDVVLRAKTAMKVGSKLFYKNEPVLYFDTLTTSSLEGAATSSYANGGRGNARLLAWEGERTLTFNMTDALISPESFAVLSGADVIDATEKPMYVHTTSRAQVVKEGTGDDAKLYVYVPGRAVWNHKGEMANAATAELTKEGVQVGNDYYNAGGDIFLMGVAADGLTEPAIPYDKGVYHVLDEKGDYGSRVKGEIYTRIECYDYAENDTVLVDYYVMKNKGKQIEITPDKFGGFFYLEASTLFRDEATGQDLPAEFVIPRCKIQSNFTFTMTSTGDPSTFDFVLDAFPDYTNFDPTKQVLAILQVVEETEAEVAEGQRAHSEKEIKTSSELTAEGAFEHKSGYVFADESYAKSDDTIASSTFRKAAPEESEP